jgi:cytochrome c553
MKLSLAALFLSLAAAPVLAMDDFVLEDEVAFCSGCHGENGVPVDLEYPVIWGQQYFYIYTQLRDYAAGRRENEIMTPIAMEYDRDQAKLLAEHFAALAWPDIPAEVQDGDAQIAQRGVTGGQCSACHGKWQGDSRIPRLAGQQVGYLSKTMLDFKHEVRMNAPDKISTMQQLDDETIEALSRYLATVDVQ